MKLKNNYSLFKPNILFFLILIIEIYVIATSIIKIPFKIYSSENIQNEGQEKSIKDMNFFVKFISSIELGNPLQKIEALFDLKSSNYFILNYCHNCSNFYSYNKSSSFFKAQTDKVPQGIQKSFYAFETFYFYDAKTNNKKEAKDMLIFLPESDSNKNSLTIGLRFPDNKNNDYQESFIQQLKHKNIINQYFWTMVFNEDKNSNKEYDGAFIFGDILRDYYPSIKDYSFNKIVQTYTGNIKKKAKINNHIELDWGIVFDDVYYELKKPISKSANSNSNYVKIDNLVSEFDFNLNMIYGTFEYSYNIKRDYFQLYFLRNICQPTYMRGSMFNYIYCHTNNFTEEDLKTFPTLYFKNVELRYTFSLDYNDLFYLTEDKKYYIFNIMIIDLYYAEAIDYDELIGFMWVFGLPFWKKYQFSFDSDNKLIYFYNSNGKFLDDIDVQEEDTNRNNEKEINDKNNTNEIKNPRKKDREKEKYYSLEVKKIFLFVGLFVCFIFLFCILIFIIKKIIFKKGFILVRVKKANELNEDEYYDYSSQNINAIKENNSKNKELEMQIQKDNY